MFFLSPFFSTSKGITRENIQEDVRNLENRGSKEKKLLKMLKDHDSALYKHLSFAQKKKKHFLYKTTLMLSVTNVNLYYMLDYNKYNELNELRNRPKNM